jgi:hypothetical protein
MARQTYYVAKDVKHPLYSTRMLKAGPIDLDAGAARLYRKLGVDLQEEAPKRAAPKAETTETEPAKKAPARKRKAAKKKTA